MPRAYPPTSPDALVVNRILRRHRAGPGSSMGSVIKCTAKVPITSPSSTYSTLMDFSSRRWEEQLGGRRRSEQKAAKNNHSQEMSWCHWLQISNQKNRTDTLLKIVLKKHQECEWCFVAGPQVRQFPKSLWLKAYIPRTHVLLSIYPMHQDQNIRTIKYSHHWIFHLISIVCCPYYILGLCLSTLLSF